jgi:hypothetical protein
MFKFIIPNKYDYDNGIIPTYCKWYKYCLVCGMKFELYPETREYCCADCVYRHREIKQ